MKLPIKKEMCYGCGLCANICHNEAIHLFDDNDGFKYPEIDNSKCIDCGLCHRVCPAINEDTSKNSMKVFVAKSKDLNILKDSTSGGMFSALSQSIINRGGVVYGTGYGKDMKIELHRVSNMESLGTLRGSKYVQCDMTEVYEKIAEDINKEKWVLYCGTPCMVAAIYSYFGEEPPKKLITIDLICNGVSSPFAWRSFVSELESKYGKKLAFYKFRTKTSGYLSKNEVATFEGGKQVSLECSLDKYGSTVYYSNLATRPSCFECKFTKSQRIGDFTIGDCAHLLDEISDSFDVSMGASVCFVNSEKAIGFLDDVCQNIVCFDVDAENAMSLRMKKPAIPNPSSADFMSSLRKVGFKKTLVSKTGWLNYYRIKLFHKIRRLTK